MGKAARLVLTLALFAFATHSAQMSAYAMVDQTGPVITLDDIVSGSADLKKAACINGTGSDTPAMSEDCNLCCTAPSSVILGQSNPTPPVIMSLIAVPYDNAQQFLTAIPPQAYQGRGPPMPV